MLFFFNEYVPYLCMILLEKLRSHGLICCFDENNDVTSAILYKIYTNSKKSTMIPKFCELLKSLLKLYNKFS